MNDVTSALPSQPAKKPIRWVTPLIYEVLLAYILVIGIGLRYVGIWWGDWQYLHPDERFLVWVGTDIQPIGTSPGQLGTPPNITNDSWRAGNYPDCQAWGGYFDASCSPLNPNNRGHGFYVYGTLPMFLTRYIVQAWYGHSGFNEMTKVGRELSAFVDILSVILVYAIGKRVFNKPVGLLAAAFSAFTVLNIQQSHFFTMDTFFSFFTLLAVYFAVRVYLEGDAKDASSTEGTGTILVAGEGYGAAPSPSISTRLVGLLKHPYFGLSIAFGIALGCAVASKLSAAPVAFLLPLAFTVIIYRKPAAERPRWLVNAILYLGIAAFVSLLIFRLFQPYAFLGPGFFGLHLNPQWLANIKEQRTQATGFIDFPPNLQWAHRPLWFSAQNMLAYGLGIPLGVLSILGFLWAGWRMLRGEWHRHLLLWVWGGFYFVWQSLQFNPTMRYQLPTYPILALYAAWGVVKLWNFRKLRLNVGEVSQARVKPSRLWWARPASVILGGLGLVTTFAWALAFSLIYARPITRVAASEWIYQNIPGPINLHIQTQASIYNQPLSLPYGYTLQASNPYQASFVAESSGTMDEVFLGHVAAIPPSQPATVSLSLSSVSIGGQPLVNQAIPVTPGGTGESVAGGYTLDFSQPVTLDAGQAYTLTLILSDKNRVLDACGAVGIVLETAIEPITQTVNGPDQCLLRSDTSYNLTFSPQANGQVSGITLSQLVDRTPPAGTQTLTLSIFPPGTNQAEATGTITADLATQANGLGKGYTITLDHPVRMIKGETYIMTMALEAGSESVSIEGTYVANEGTWDDPLPVRIDGYDAWGGIYPLHVMFDMYTDDGPDKLNHFIDIYNQSEYIVISSNRQWGSLPRIPERFPMTVLHYRHLLGCPDEKTIQWCYSVAQPGMFHGDLGFELVAVFQSDPSLGPFKINDQFAEEAFTVYDHPKVLVFKKTDAYSTSNARQILSQADFSEMIHISPQKAAVHPANLLLPEDHAAVQQAGGTWSQLFDPNAWQNRFQVLGVVVWYLSVGLLGLLVYPLLRLAFPGLADHGYAVARTAGMLILAYLTWLAGSLNIPFSRLTISLVLLLIAIAGAVLAYRQRNELRQDWRVKRNYFLVVEGLALAFFLFFLLVRLGNPDLWHPWKGGEKPMDFSYFNAVLKSTTFPPYDPWYAGGSMNYYYWGYVFVGVLVKWLGIVPSFAYNLVLPTLLSLVAMGAFCLGYNLSQLHNRHESIGSDQAAAVADPAPPKPSRRPYLVGLASALGMAMLGNLGTLRMIARGWEQLGVPGGLTDSTGFFARLVGFFVGLGQVLFHGAKMPYALADWYWLPSRAIPAPNDVEPITEFPIFTFLYADLHAHMIAMAIAMLAITWAVAVLMGKARWHSLGAGALGITLGGLAIGALYPTNLSDIYTYLPISMLVFGYAIFRYADLSHITWLPAIPALLKRLALAILGPLLLAVLSFELFLPYRLWYAQPYSSVTIWTGTHTPFWSYLTHWGLFLFVIISWMVWETREWMASTPLASLRKLEKYTGLIILFVVLLFLACLLLSIRIPNIETMSLLNKLPIGRGATMAWFILPLAAWVAVLLIRPGLPDAKRLVLFLVGTGLIITLMVEVVVVRGDIGRMNTVFKFYVQVWGLFAVCSAAALGWLLEPVRHWLPGWRLAWRAAFAFLVFSAFLFTLYGTMAKIKDRWVATAPHTLDGMAYMPYATYFESYPNKSSIPANDQSGVNMDLSQDYRAIRWMQENIQGSPVIVEANSRNLYRWYSRFTIYTGLPGVVGWEWHQQQQRALNPPEWVTNRILDIDQFYQTVDPAAAKKFLEHYNVRYIVVGQLEQVTYPGPGLDKFTAQDGILWNQVYHDENTTIYEVIQ